MWCCAFAGSPSTGRRCSFRAIANLGRPMAPVTATITLHTTGGLTGWRAVTGSPHFCSVRLTPGAEVAAGTARGLRRDSPHRVGSDPDRSFLPSVGTLAIRCEDHGENGTKQCGRELASLGDAQAHLLGPHAGDGGHRFWNLASRCVAFPSSAHWTARLPPGGDALSANMTETPAPLGITVGRWR